MNKKKIATTPSSIVIRKKFVNYVSLGYFCSVASELERMGLRTCSGPFDWQASRNFELRVLQIDDRFKEFFAGLTEEGLYQKKDEPSIYFHSLIDTFLVHDFNSYDPLPSQLKIVVEKYKRRVDSFYRNIKNPTLFLHYIYDQKNAEWIDNNYSKIIRIIQKFNDNNDIIFIANNDILIKNISCVYFVEPDTGDVVARRFLEKLPELRKFLNESSNIGFQSRFSNSLFYFRTKLKKKWFSIKDKNKTLQQSHYIHQKIYEDCF